MANNRITYATAQVSIKDNKVAATNVISNDYVVGILSSGISDSEIEIGLTAELSGLWPDSCDIMIDDEQINYASWSTTSGCGTLTRGANGTTAATHLVDAEVKLKAWEVPYGMQNSSISTAFNTEDVFQIGQLDTYENLETLPEIEVSMERVLDGSKPLWLMCTDSRFTTLKGRTADFKVDIAVNVYPDSQDSATGTADSVVICSGMYVSSVGYNLTTDGNFTESVTMIGNDKTWNDGAIKPSGHFPSGAAFYADKVEKPGIGVGSGVQRSEDFDAAGSTLPAEISADDHIQSISVSADIGREDIYELGTKAPYYRAVSFPIEVTCSFEVITSAGDGVEALSAQNNLTARQITIVTDGGLNINLGGNNKLTSVSYGDFSTGGDSATCTFEYSNSNSLLVTHAAE